MSITDWLYQPPEGCIEIEENYLRLLIPKGSSWVSKWVSLADTDVFEVLRKEMPATFGSLRQASIVLSVQAQSGARILPFPAGMTKEEILEHLVLKREDYFGGNVDMVFALRQLPGPDPKNHDYLVSYVNRPFLNRLENLFSAMGFTLNRVTTAIEAMIGAYYRQRSGRYEKQVCLISLGYSAVHMAVLRDGQVSAVRTSLTGALKEVEMRLMGALKLKQNEVDELLTGTAANADQHSLEIIQQNSRELLARITPFFAYIRSKDKEPGDQKIYFSLPYLEVAGIKALLGETFKMPVESLNGGATVTGPVTPGQSDGCWLSGVLESHLISLVEPRAPFLRFTLSPRLAWLFVIFFLSAPIGLLHVNKRVVQQDLEILQRQNEQYRPSMEQSRMNRQLFDQVVRLGSVVQKEFDSQVPVSDLVAMIARQLQGNLRLEKVVVSPANRQLSLNGVTIDTETALRFWDAMQKLPGLQDVKITFPESSSPTAMNFAISAGLKK